VTVVGTGPAARLPAGRSLTVGFDGVYRSGNPLPTDFWLNGSECVPVLTFGGKGAGETTGDAGDEGGGSSKGAKKPKNNEHD
jgi:hypothetical protein